jgi:hypothetical protein
MTKLLWPGCAPRQSQEAFLSYFDTGPANNGGTETMNSLSNATATLPPASATGTNTNYACCS